MTVNEIATEVHDRAWVDSAVKPLGRSFLLSYLPRLEQMDSRELLFYNFCNFDLSYNMAFLLSGPELWEQWTLADWVEIAIDLSPRPSIGRFDPTGRYSDIVLFHKWLGLDGLGFAVSQTGIPLEDKQRICHYCRANALFLLPLPEDSEDLDGEVLCSVDRLTDYRARLLALDQHLQLDLHDEQAFRAYIESIATRIGK